MKRYESEAKEAKLLQSKALISEKMRQHFREFFAPLLSILDELLDCRLVNTFADLLMCLLLVRSRGGFLLSELGGYLLSPEQAPNGLVTYCAAKNGIITTLLHIYNDNQ